jgi:hypothetical protein
MDNGKNKSKIGKEFLETLLNAGKAAKEWTDDGSGSLGPIVTLPGGVAIIHVWAETGLSYDTVVVVSHGGVVPTPYELAKTVGIAAKAAEIAAKKK